MNLIFHAILTVSPFNINNLTVNVENVSHGKNINKYYFNSYVYGEAGAGSLE